MGCYSCAKRRANKQLSAPQKKTNQPLTKDDGSCLYSNEELETFLNSNLAQLTTLDIAILKSHINSQKNKICGSYGLQISYIEARLGRKVSNRTT